MSIVLRIKSNCGRKLKGPEVELRQLWSKYRKSAADRNKSWCLSEADFKNLLSGNCHYCGVKPSQKRLDVHNNRPPFLYNGIDRIDSKGGYVYENVVTCCGFCNRAKSQYSAIEFIEWLNQITEYRKDFQG